MGKKKELLERLKTEIDRFESVEKIRRLTRLPALMLKDLTFTSRIFGYVVMERPGANPIVRLYVEDDGFWYHIQSFDLSHIRALDRVVEQLKADVAMRTYGPVTFYNEEDHDPRTE